MAMRMDSNCSNLQYRNIASHHCSMARGLPTPMPHGYRHAIHLAQSVRLVSRTHLSSLFWASPANLATNRTMNTLSQYTQDRTFNTAGRRNRRHIIYQDYHHQTPRARKEEMSCVTPGPMAKCCHQSLKFLRELSLDLWTDIEKCVEDRRRTCRRVIK